MKALASLPITAEQSRSARFQLGLPQTAVIAESGLQGYKLKQFETGRFTPDIAFLKKLRDFYEEKGIEIGDPEEASEGPARRKPASGESMVRPIQRMCFYVSDDLEDDQVNTVLGRMDNNDERIAAILTGAVAKDFFGDYSEETETAQRELFGLMAENYLLFRLLQGRNIVRAAPADGEGKTHAELLSKFFAQSPLADLAASQSNDGNSGNAPPVPAPAPTVDADA